MSHEISFQGQAEGDAFFVATPAWHQHGIVLDNPPTLDEALITAHMDYTVEKQTSYRRQLNDLGDVVYVPNKQAFVTLRTDTRTELGMVGPQYTVVQNRDAFRAIEPLLDSGVVQLDAGGVLRAGQDAWLLGKFDITKFGPIVQEGRMALGPIKPDPPITKIAMMSSRGKGGEISAIQLSPARVLRLIRLGSRGVYAGP